jgi:hypothetical protein
MRLSGAAVGTYRPQYRPLSAIRYLDVNPLPTRYTLFIILPVSQILLSKLCLVSPWNGWITASSQASRSKVSALPFTAQISYSFSSFLAFHLTDSMPDNQLSAF